MEGKVFRWLLLGMGEEQINYKGEFLKREFGL
jgi:hypothetical protein